MAALASHVFGDTNQATSGEPKYTVKLRYEKEIRLSESTTQMLYSNAMQLVKTSNFNSRQSKTQSWAEYTATSIHEEYRRAVSGKYLLLTLKEPQVINTVGGEISVQEIVIGLNRPDYASSLFTVDGEGRVVGHGKYSGPLCVEITEQVKKIVANN
jgi:hypothetical protein